MFLSERQLRTLGEVKAAGRAVRVWKSRNQSDWRWMVRDKPCSATVDNLLRAGCLALNDNDRHTATVTALGRTVLAELKG